jgi:hypothetical protein
MGVRHDNSLARLTCKSLEGRFLQEVREGLNCSPFESEAVLDVVRDVFLPYLSPEAATPMPGRVSLVVVDADEPAGKPIRQCEMRTVLLTLHRGPEDDRILQEQGPAAFRLARIPDLCQQALSQGGLLTREDLAYRVFFVTPRTISRDLATLREQTPDRPLPLRSNVQDIGPVLTHRVQIVRLALEGRTHSEICRIMHHSPAAVANYLSTFARIAWLARQQIQPGQIAFLVRRGRRLVNDYLALLALCERDDNLRTHLDDLLTLHQQAEKKWGGSVHGR